MVPCLTEQDLHISFDSNPRLTLLGGLIERLLGRQRLFSQTRSIILWAAATDVVTGHPWQQNPLLGHALMNYAASIIFWTGGMWQIHQLLHSLFPLFHVIWQMQDCSIMCFSACPASHTTSNSRGMLRSDKKGDILHGTVTRRETSFTLPSEQHFPVELQLNVL